MSLLAPLTLQVQVLKFIYSSGPRGEAAMSDVASSSKGNESDNSPGGALFAIGVVTSGVSTGLHCSVVDSRMCLSFCKLEMTIKAPSSVQDAFQPSLQLE